MSLPDMPRPYWVGVTLQAQEQIREIARYIAVELATPNTALRIIDMLDGAFLSLSNLPHRIALTEEEPWRSYGIHKMYVKCFFVYFWIDEEASRVHVTAVIYGKRNQEQLLSRMSMDEDRL